METILVVQHRYAGFAGLALGGYVGGWIAGIANRPIEVTLRRPIPLGEPLNLLSEGTALRLTMDDRVVAEAAPDPVALEIPDPLTVPEAKATSRAYPGFEGHLFPGCFTCGPGRKGGDGLRIFPGPAANGKGVSAPWTPSESDAREDGTIGPEIIWSALDCPAIWALILANDPDSPDHIVSGRLSARLVRTVRADQTYVVMAWPRGAEGRRLFAGAALFDEDGQLVAVGKQTCVLVERGIPLGRRSWHSSR